MKYFRKEHSMRDELQLESINFNQKEMAIDSTIKIDNLMDMPS
jgi:hypothetical protein